MAVLKKFSLLVSIHRSKLFAIVFIVTAFALTYWSMQRIPHSVILHVNNTWHIMLVGETKTNAILFRTSNFEIIKEDMGNLWLTGTGKINWQDHMITIHKDGIRLGEHHISTSMHEMGVNMMFYPDGRVTKGKLQLK